MWSLLVPVITIPSSSVDSRVEKKNDSEEVVQAEMKCAVSPGAMEANSFPRGRYGGS